MYIIVYLTNVIIFLNVVCDCYLN